MSPRSEVPTLLRLSRLALPALVERLALETAEGAVVLSGGGGYERGGGAEAARDGVEAFR